MTDVIDVNLCLIHSVFYVSMERYNPVQWNLTYVGLSYPTALITQDPYNDIHGYFTVH